VLKTTLFVPPFGRLRGNVRTSSIARWKARVQLPIRHNWTFYARSYCWDVAGGNLSTWAIFEGGGSLRSLIFGGRGRRPPTTVGWHGWQKTRMIALSYYGIKMSATQVLPMGSIYWYHSKGNWLRYNLWSACIPHPRVRPCPIPL